MAFGLPGYNITPMNYTGKDGILFHLKEDMSVFLKLSATTDMNYASPMEVTTQPVQDGQVITDNVQEKPKTININGVVVVGYEGAFFQTKNTTVVEDFVATLETWRKQRQVLRVLCKDGITLENAICTQFEAKKDKTISNGLNISLAFQDVTFVVQVGQTTAPNNTEKNANGSKAGAKAKDGAVKAKSNIGKASTKLTAPKNCQGIFDLDQAGTHDAALDSKVESAMDACKRRGWHDSTGVHYNEREASPYIDKVRGYIDNTYGAQGGNVNKQVK